MPIEPGREAETGAHRPWRLTQGLGRNVFVLGVVSLFTDISSEMVYPIVPIFLTTVLHAPMDVLGLIEGIAESVASLLKWAAGAWSDRLGRRTPFVVFGYGISSISKPLLFLAASWHGVLFSRLIDRFGKGLRTAPRDVMIAAACDPARRGKAFGFHRAMDTVGACIGPLLAVFMLHSLHMPLRSIFVWAFVPAALGVLTLFFLQKSPPAARAIHAVPEDAPTRAPLPGSLKRFIAIYALFALGNSSDVFLILRAKSLGFSDTQTLLTYVFYNFVYAAAATPAGWISDHVSRRKLMTGGLIVFALVYAGFAAARAPWMIWALFALYGFYGAATEGVAKAYVTDLAPAARRGAALGLYQAVSGLTVFFASVVAGALWKNLGPWATFAYGAALALAAALLLTLRAERNKPSPV